MTRFSPLPYPSQHATIQKQQNPNVHTSSTILQQILHLRCQAQNATPKSLAFFSSKESKMLLKKN